MAPRQPFDPEFPTSPFVPRAPAPPPPPNTDAQRARILWVQSRSVPVDPGQPDINLMSIPAATAIDVFISYAPEEELQTIKSPDGREVFRLFVNEQLTSRQAASFTPGGVPDFVLGVMNGNVLPVAGRIFALRDFPADGWELKVDTSACVFLPKPIPADLDIFPVKMLLNVTCIGWAREPTGIGPFELQTAVTGDVKDDLLVTGIFENGLTTPVLSPAAFETFTRTQLVDFMPYWDPARAKGVAGSANVLLCVADTHRSDVPSIPPKVFKPAIRALSDTETGALKAEPSPVISVFTEALTGAFVASGPLFLPPDGLTVDTILATFVGVSGRIDAAAPSGVYYVQLWSWTGLPANGQAVTIGTGGICAPLKISHGFGADDYFQFDLSAGGFVVRFGLFLVVTLSTTEFSKSPSPGNFMSVSAMFRLAQQMNIDEVTGLPA